MGSVRGFKSACASGTFATFKLGRETAALWSDVEAYVEGRTLPTRKTETKPTEEDPDRAAVAAVGFALRPANNSRRAGKAAR
jgi:hypothetical protein